MLLTFVDLWFVDKAPSFIENNIFREIVNRVVFSDKVQITVPT